MKKKFSSGLMLGALVGIVAGILTAPKSGKRTRAEIKQKYEDTRQDFEDAYEEVKATAEKTVETAKDVAEDIKWRADSVASDVKDAAVEEPKPRATSSRTKKPTTSK